MPKLECMELRLDMEGHYSRYASFVGGTNPLIANPVRYAMGVTHSAEKAVAADKLMFVGGIGVLGNIVKHQGEDVISRWRGTHDLDILINGREHVHIVPRAFDELDVWDKSLSIPSKYTARGKSRDYEGQDLSPIAADVYFPADCGRYIPLEGKRIGRASWDNAVLANFFGIDVAVMDPAELLGLKLSISTQSGMPRQRDCQDVYHLVAAAERMGNSPVDLKRKVGQKNFDKLGKVVKTAAFDKSFTRLMNPSREMMGELIYR